MFFYNFLPKGDYEVGKMNVVSRILMVTLIVGLLQPLFAGSDMVRAADKLYGLATGQTGSWVMEIMVIN